MKILLQWSLATPKGWVEIDSAEWSHIPKKSEPLGGQVVDNAPGWIHYLNVQGVVFTADHYAVEDLDDASGGIRVTMWNDDPEDYPEGEKYARVFTFLPLAPDPQFGGAWNTRQSKVIYAQTAVLARMTKPSKNTQFRPWEEFVRPPERPTRHGIWTDNALNVAHVALSVGQPRGWREWTEGVPEQFIRHNKVIPQRPLGLYNQPLGTKTVYQRDTDLANGIHAALAVGNENELNATAGAGETEASGNIGGAEDGILFVFTSATNFPNDTAWPTGTYRCELDVSTVGADITYGLLNQGGSVGHFGRVDSGLTSDLETKQQTESAFTADSGLQLATTGSVSWSAGASTDRFECVVTGARPASHGQQSMTLTFDTDAFADGPWPAGNTYNETPSTDFSLTGDAPEGKVYAEDLSDTQIYTGTLDDFRSFTELPSLNIETTVDVAASAMFAEDNVVTQISPTTTETQSTFVDSLESSLTVTGAPTDFDIHNELPTETVILPLNELENVLLIDEPAPEVILAFNVADSLEGGGQVFDESPSISFEIHSIKLL